MNVAASRKNFRDSRNSLLFESEVGISLPVAKTYVQSEEL